MSEINLFLQATKQNLTFDSPRGELTVQQLWTLPLQAKNGFDLDSIAQSVNSQLKEASETSFVKTKPNPKKSMLELKLEVIKAVIADKLADAEAAKSKEAKRLERLRLKTALDAKNEEALAGMSREEIAAKLAALGEDD